MRIFVWLFRAAIFFSLFAFALNNQDVTPRQLVLRPRSGEAPHGVHRAGSLRARLRVRRAGDGAELVAPSARRTATSPGARIAPRRLPRSARHAGDPAFVAATRWTLTCSGCCSACRSPSRSAGWLRASTCASGSANSARRHRPTSRGLILLLNEQQDKAIDAFIEAVQQDPNSTDLHFALGNLFRRRGEYERAVRVHEHLLKRADLPAALRERAQDALAQDFMKAGLFDRAEAGLPRARGQPLRYRRPAGPALAATSARATGAPPSKSRASSSTAARPRSRRASRTTGARSPKRPTRGSRPTRPRKRCSRRSSLRRRRRGPLVLAGRRLARLRRARPGDAGLRRTAGRTSGFVRPRGARPRRQRARLRAQVVAREQLESHYRRDPSTDLLAAIALLDAGPGAPARPTARSSARTADARRRHSSCSRWAPSAA